MRYAIVKHYRPVLSHRSIGRNPETIGVTAIEVIAIFVLDGEKIELSRAQILGGEEYKAADDAIIRLKAALEGWRTTLTTG